MTTRILLVDDDRAFRMSTGALLEEEGHRVTQAEDATAATAALEVTGFDLIIMDLRMPGLDGIALAEVLRKRGNGTPILMISGFGTVDSAVRALHTGVDDFITKPVEPEVLLDRVDALIRMRPGSGVEGDAPGGLVGRSEAMAHTIEDLRRVAVADATVLLTGETGTGKELAARAIHELSARSTQSFVTVNCAALAEGVLESELFGHVRGAFTGAVRDRPGLIRSASGGTLFLDEIGDVTEAVQRRLLRVIQEREVVPVGATRPDRVDVRLVAATNRDLEADVAAGRFREDLYFRLNVYPVRMPALRERKTDIPVLVEHFLGRHVAGTPPRVSPLTMRTLLGHDWPGNVRQLFSALESALIRSGGGSIEAHHLPADVRVRGSRVEPSAAYRGPTDDSNERAAILRALEAAEGVRVRAAAQLGMSRTTLWRKMRDYGIEG